MDSVNVGDTVRIDKCDSYPKLVGSNAEVRAVLSDNRVALKYGRGRPPARSAPTRHPTPDQEVRCPA